MWISLPGFGAVWMYYLWSFHCWKTGLKGRELINHDSSDGLEKYARHDGKYVQHNWHVSTLTVPSTLLVANPLFLVLTARSIRKSHKKQLWSVSKRKKKKQQQNPASYVEKTQKLKKKCGFRENLEWNCWNGWGGGTYSLSPFMKFACFGDQILLHKKEMYARNNTHAGSFIVPSVLQKLMSQVFAGNQWTSMWTNKKCRDTVGATSLRTWFGEPCTTMPPPPTSPSLHYSGHSTDAAEALRVDK